MNGEFEESKHVKISDVIFNSRLFVNFMEEALCLLLDIERYIVEDNPTSITKLESTLSQAHTDRLVLEQENIKLSEENLRYKEILSSRLSSVEKNTQLQDNVHIIKQERDALLLKYNQSEISNSQLRDEIKALKLSISKQNDIWKDVVQSKDDTIEDLKKNELKGVLDEKATIELELEKYKVLAAKQLTKIETIKTDLNKARQDSELKIQQLKLNYENQISQLAMHSDVHSIEAFYKQKLLSQKVELEKEISLLKSKLAVESRKL